MPECNWCGAQLEMDSSDQMVSGMCSSCLGLDISMAKECYDWEEEQVELEKEDDEDEQD